MAGGVIVVLSSYILGCSKSFEYKNRVEYLQSMYSCLFQLENEISYTQTPLASAFKKIADNAHVLIENILNYASVKFDNAEGELLSQIWKDAVLEYTESISGDDLELFLSFGVFLGNSDAEGQLKNIAMFKEKIKHQSELAEEQYRINNKLFKSAGLYAGIIIAILFM